MNVFWLSPLLLCRSFKYLQELKEEKNNFQQYQIDRLASCWNNEWLKCLSSWNQCASWDPKKSGKAILWVELREWAIDKERERSVYVYRFPCWDLTMWMNSCSHKTTARIKNETEHTPNSCKCFSTFHLNSCNQHKWKVYDDLTRYLEEFFCCQTHFRFSFSAASLMCPPIIHTTAVSLSLSLSRLAHIHIVSFCVNSIHFKVKRDLNSC